MDKDFYKMQDPYYANTVSIEEYEADVEPEDERVSSLIYSVSMSFEKDGTAKESSFNIWHIEYSHEEPEIIEQGQFLTLSMTIEARREESYKDFSKRCIKVLIDEYYKIKYNQKKDA